MPMFYLMVPVLLVIGIAFLILKLKEGRELRESRKRDSIVKRNGSALNVNFDECEVIYLPGKRKVVEMVTYRRLDELIGVRREPKYHTVDRCIVEYKLKENGKVKSFYSATINKDRETLLGLLAAKKSTNIYINKKGEYFFDLSFLDD